MWPRLFDLLFLSVLFCICTAPFDFTKSLYIFHAGSLLSFFVLLPFSFPSSVTRSTLFFLSSFLLYLFFQPFPFVSLFVVSFFLFDYLSLCVHFLSLSLHFCITSFSLFLSASLCLHFYFRSFTHFYFSFELRASCHVTPYSLVGGYQHFGRACNLLLQHALKILLAIYLWTFGSVFDRGHPVV
jgi:hypothetical protein